MKIVKVKIIDDIFIYQNGTQRSLKGEAVDVVIHDGFKDAHYSYRGDVSDSWPNGCYIPPEHFEIIENEKPKTEPIQNLDVLYNLCTLIKSIEFK